MYLGHFIKFSVSPICLTSAESLSNPQILSRSEGLSGPSWELRLRAVLGFNLRPSPFGASEICSIFFGETGIRKGLSSWLHPGGGERPDAEDVCGWQRRMKDIEGTHGAHPGEESINLIKMCVCVCV